MIGLINVISGSFQKTRMIDKALARGKKINMEN